MHSAVGPPCPELARHGAPVRTATQQHTHTISTKHKPAEAPVMSGAGAEGEAKQDACSASDCRLLLLRIAMIHLPSMDFDEIDQFRELCLRPVLAFASPRPAATARIIRNSISVSHDISLRRC